jgi:hypothetical protein
MATPTEELPGVTYTLGKLRLYVKKLDEDVEEAKRDIRSKINSSGGNKELELFLTDLNPFSMSKILLYVKEECLHLKPKYELKEDTTSAHFILNHLENPTEGTLGMKLKNMIEERKRLGHMWEYGHMIAAYEKNSHDWRSYTLKEMTWTLYLNSEDAECKQAYDMLLERITRDGYRICKVEFGCHLTLTPTHESKRRALDLILAEFDFLKDLPIANVVGMKEAEEVD